MMPKTHVILGLIFSVIIYLISPSTGLFGALIIFLSSFLIDLDHYLIFVKRKKNPCLADSFNYWRYDIRKEATIEKSKGHKVKAPITLFHTIEFLILIIILAFLFKIFLFVLIGFLFHHLLDILDLGYRKHILVRQYSLILSIFFRSKRYKYI